MNPADYSDEILDTPFATFVYRDDRFGEKGRFLRCSTTMWLTPPEFTIRQARDGISVSMGRRKVEFKLSDYRLEMLRRAAEANDNRIVALNSDKHRHSILYVSVLPYENKELFEKAKTELEEVNKKIKETVGPLLARQKELKELISESKKGPDTITVDGKEKLVWS